jgi:CPA1 family monovalent cation:H+ antiporter
VNTAEVVIGLLVVAVALARLGKGIATPTPVIFVVAGLLLGVASRFVPGLPSVVLDPDIVFFVFLPPLLASAALDIPFGPFRANIRPIALLAVGLVLATMAAVGFVVHAVTPEIPLAAALALGAIVAPPDPVAATSVARLLGIPNRLVTILEGEGLVNDATALVAYKVAVTAVATGYFSWSEAGARFVFAGSVGIGSGLVVGWATGLALRTLQDEVLETATALLAPYLAYLLADRVGASGVLAVVTVGFFLQRRTSVPGDASARLVSRSVWQTLIFIINGAVFILVGLQIGEIAAAGMPAGTLRAAALVSAVVIWVRLGWMFIVPLVLRVILPGRGDHGIPSVAGLAILGWAGMRGVVSLAVALSLPLRTASGEPFPARAELILLAFGVIFATLVLQGLTLRPLVRALGMADPTARRREHLVARRAAVSAAKRHIRKMLIEGEITRRQARQLRRSLTPVSTEDVDEHTALRRARSEVLEAERRVIHHLVQSGEIGDPTGQELEAALDIQTMGLHLQDEREKEWRRRNEEEQGDR